MLKPAKNHELLDPMLISIWELAGGAAYKAVPLKEVINRTLIKIGLDPKKEKIQGSDGWSLKLRMLFRSHMEEVPSHNPGYVSLSGYGKWSITPLGIAYITESYPDIELSTNKLNSYSGPNETSIWLSDNASELHKYLSKNLPKTLKMSATLGSIDDHIQTFFVKIITNNALNPHIKANKRISFSMLNAWAIRSAYSEFTTMGQEPVERVMRNAKTETELNLEKLNKREESLNFDNSNITTSPGLGVEILLQNTWDSDSTSISYDTDSFDFELYDSANTEDTLLSKFSFQENFNYIKSQISEAFSRSKDQQLAIKVFEDMILTNKNIQEIAESNATATSKIYGIINKIKEESSKAYKKGNLTI
jgi:hypothetical protein